MALEAQCYSEASSAALNSLFFIGITSLIIERETGTAVVQSVVSSHYTASVAASVMALGKSASDFV
jgi:hypothetical protein